MKQTVVKIAVFALVAAVPSIASAQLRIYHEHTTAEGILTEVDYVLGKPYTVKNGRMIRLDVETKGFGDLSDSEEYSVETSDRYRASALKSLLGEGRLKCLPLKEHIRTERE